MEENNGLKIMKKVFIGITCVAILGGSITAVILNKDKIFKSDQNTIVQIQNNNQEYEENNQSKKIEEDKGWVYDADYCNDNTVKTIDEEYYDLTKSNEELMVPFININSQAANEVNEKIKNIYDKAYEEFGQENTNGTVNYRGLEYQYYINGNILSIVITRKVAVVNSGLDKYLYTYNFNIDTLEIASLEEVYKECGFNSKLELEEKIGIAVENYKIDSLNRLELKEDIYYIDSNNKFNVAIVPDAGSYAEESLVVDKDVTKKEIPEEEKMPEENGNSDNNISENIDENNNTNENNINENNANENNTNENYINENYIDENYINENSTNENSTTVVISYNNETNDLLQ